MGADIHPSMEYLSGGKWRYYGQLHSGRNYAFFGLLSDVRGTGPAHFTLVNEKNINDLDLSKEVEEDWERGHMDWHSLSVGGIAELNALRKTLLASKDKEQKSHTLPRVDLWLNTLNSVKAQYGVDDVRVVAWYDN